ncbi:hypothetical protein RI444_22730 (plasmid) [Paenarthrobacter sp. AT5]|uniref:hypothetical protein n=1 Tax=Paenarthrobacter sp. AT5 TaxID=2973089 RepID=UPI0029349E91|nr:hypothetical protein [Paenarthrobacter sp. AT5]WOC63472.1 hypothetical protein RI444_22730 [Paenarthrobacter sp. AT5]
MDHAQDGAQSASVAGLLAALTFIDNVGFHGIATTLTGSEPKIDRNWAALIRNAQIAVAVTALPDELRPAGDRFTAAAEKLIAVLERRDINAVADPAKELHIAYHALSDAGWNHLAGTAGFSAGNDQPGAGHHH